MGGIGKMEKHFGLNNLNRKNVEDFLHLLCDLNLARTDARMKEIETSPTDARMKEIETSLTESRPRGPTVELKYYWINESSNHHYYFSYISQFAKNGIY